MTMTRTFYRIWTINITWPVQHFVVTKGSFAMFSRCISTFHSFYKGVSIFAEKFNSVRDLIGAHISIDISKTYRVCLFRTNKNFLWRRTVDKVGLNTNQDNHDLHLSSSLVSQAKNLAKILCICVFMFVFQFFPNCNAEAD